MNNRVLGATLFLAALLANPASATGLFRTYLSAAGSDSNPCTLQLPCRLLPAALAATADGGEVWMLNSANFNVAQVEVTQSVTILAIPGVVGSVVATGGGHGIHVNAPGIKVALRNLVIVHLTSSGDGINIAQGAAVDIEGCEIANVSGNGINVSSAMVTVKDTTIREVGAAGVVTGSSGNVSLKRVHITGAALGVSVLFGTQAMVSESVISGGGTGVFVMSGAAGSPLAVVERSVISGNANAVQVNQLNAANLNAGFFGNTISGNGTGITVNAFGASEMVVLDGNSVSGPAGLAITGTPTLYSRGNNFISTVTGGPPTPLAGQ